MWDKISFSWRPGRLGRVLGCEVILCAVVVKISKRTLVAIVAVTSNTPQQHQILRIFVGQIAQQDSIGNAEDCRVRANAEGKREHGDGSETRTLPQLPQRVTKVPE